MSLGMRFVVSNFSKEILKIKIIKLCYLKANKQQRKEMSSKMQQTGERENRGEPENHVDNLRVYVFKLQKVGLSFLWQ